MTQLDRVLLYASAIAVTACGGGSVSGASGADEFPDARADIARVRVATEPFHSIDAAAAAGYAATVPDCVAHAEHGAMGFHHTNPALLDDKLEVERPEILVYERMPGGEYVLNGVEYVVPYAARARDAEPPVIMGHKLKRADGLELWYLHAWIWKENATGMFADWNLAVECRS